MSIDRAYATIGGLSLVSRILGFLRDIMIADVLARAKAVLESAAK